MIATDGVENSAGSLSQRRFGTCSYRSIKSILEKGLERQNPEPELPLNSPVHQNVRGQAYYAAASKAEGLC